MSNEQDPPLRRVWQRVKDRAPRQKTVATVTAVVRRAKPGTPARARELLVAEAAKRGVTDLSDKELSVMVDAVTTSARDATTQAVTKGASQVRSLWASLQTSAPQWTELPDDVAALNLRSDQTALDAPVQIDAPDVVVRLLDDLSAGGDGVRRFDCWLSLDPATGAVTVHVGRSVLGRVGEPQAGAVRDLLARRRAWTPATLRGDDPVTSLVTVELPDHA